MDFLEGIIFRAVLSILCRRLVDVKDIVGGDGGQSQRLAFGRRKEIVRPVHKRETHHAVGTGCGDSEKRLASRRLAADLQNGSRRNRAHVRKIIRKIQNVSAVSEKVFVRGTVRKSVRACRLAAGHALETDRSAFRLDGRLAATDIDALRRIERVPAEINVAVFFRDEREMGCATFAYRIRRVFVKSPILQDGRDKMIVTGVENARHRRGEIRDHGRIGRQSAILVIGSRVIDLVERIGKKTVVRLRLDSGCGAHSVVGERAVDQRSRIDQIALARMRRDETVGEKAAARNGIAVCRQIAVEPRTDERHIVRSVVSVSGGAGAVRHGVRDDRIRDNDIHRLRYSKTIEDRKFPKYTYHPKACIHLHTPYIHIRRFRKCKRHNFLYHYIQHRFPNHYTIPLFRKVSRHLHMLYFRRH